MSEPSEQKLRAAFERIAGFKHENLRRTAVAILEVALTVPNGCVFPDEPRIESAVAALAKADKNIVGVAWKWLGRLELMRRTGQRRKSKAAAANGREIAMWTIGRRALAETFVRRNGGNATVAQRELSL